MEDATIVCGTESLDRSGSSQKPVTDQAARNLGLSQSGHRDEARAGFVDIRIEPTRVYTTGDARAWLTSGSLDVDSIAPQVEGKFMSAFIGARKPG